MRAVPIPKTSRFWCLRCGKVSLAGQFQLRHFDLAFAR